MVPVIRLTSPDGHDGTLYKGREGGWRIASPTGNWRRSLAHYTDSPVRTLESKSGDDGRVLTVRVRLDEGDPRYWDRLAREISLSERLEPAAIAVASVADRRPKRSQELERSGSPVNPLATDGTDLHAFVKRSVSVRCPCGSVTDLYDETCKQCGLDNPASSLSSRSRHIAAAFDVLGERHVEGLSRRQHDWSAACESALDVSVEPPPDVEEEGEPYRMALREYFLISLRGLNPALPLKTVPATLEGLAEDARVTVESATAELFAVLGMDGGQVEKLKRANPEFLKAFQRMHMTAMAPVVSVLQDAGPGYAEMATSYGPVNTMLARPDPSWGKIILNGVRSFFMPFGAVYRLGRDFFRERKEAEQFETFAGLFDDYRPAYVENLSVALEVEAERMGQLRDRLANALATALFLSFAMAYSSTKSLAARRDATERLARWAGAPLGAGPLGSLTRRARVAVAVSAICLLILVVALLVVMR